MGYGDIIKRAWTITWRYRALWVLGLFAGVAGGSSGGSSSGSNYRSRSTTSGMESLYKAFDPSSWAEQLSRFLPALIAVAVILFVAGLVLTILRVSARGGLVYAVNQIEQARPYTVSAAWGAGFARFWRLLGLAILLGLPLALVALGLGLAVMVPIVLPLLRGGALDPGSFAPLCGVAVIALPILIIGGIVLGVMHQLGLRYIMLDDVGVFDAAGTAWRTFRTRLKDSLIMWFVNLGLNIVAGAVLAIPVAVVIAAATIPAVLSIRDGSYTVLFGLSAVAVFIVIALVAIWTAIWGTFTSSLWTVFFRRLTGREVLVAAAESSYVPPTPPMPEPPVTPESTPVTPPMSIDAPEGTAS